jgi:hypothetical protein
MRPMRKSCYLRLIYTGTNIDVMTEAQGFEARPEARAG